MEDVCFGLVLAKRIADLLHLLLQRRQLLEQFHKILVRLLVKHTLVLLSNCLVVLLYLFFQNFLFTFYLFLFSLQLFLAKVGLPLLLFSEFLVLKLLFVGFYGGLNLVIQLVYFYQLLSDLLTLLEQFFVLFFLGLGLCLLFLFDLALPFVNLAHLFFHASPVLFLLERALFFNFLKFGKRLLQLLLLLLLALLL